MTYHRMTYLATTYRLMPYDCAYLLLPYPWPALLSCGVGILPTLYAPMAKMGQIKNMNVNSSLMVANLQYAMR
jgi:hypothetical protein